MCGLRARSHGKWSKKLLEVCGLIMTETCDRTPAVGTVGGRWPSRGRTAGRSSGASSAGASAVGWRAGRGSTPGSASSWTGSRGPSQRTTFKFLNCHQPPSRPVVHKYITISVISWQINLEKIYNCKVIKYVICNDSSRFWFALRRMGPVCPAVKGRIRKDKWISSRVVDYDVMFRLSLHHVGSVISCSSQYQRKDYKPVLVK